MFRDMQQEMSSNEKALMGHIRDWLIQRLHKFPDLDGKGTNWYNSVEEFILLNGKAVQLRSVPNSKMPWKKCYANAEATALYYPGDFFYMEGYAAYLDDDGFDVYHHGWVVDIHSGICYDPTWKKGATVALGCIFPVGVQIAQVHTHRGKHDAVCPVGEQRINRFNLMRGSATTASLHIPHLQKESSVVEIFNTDTSAEATRPYRWGSYDDEQFSPNKSTRGGVLVSRPKKRVKKDATK